jgi:hypothetical protein
MRRHQRIFAELFREFPMRTAIVIGALAVFAILGQALVACCLAFQPGWANGFSVSKYTVFATVMSGIVFMMLMSGGAAVLAVPCAWFERRIKHAYAGWWAFALLMLLLSAVAVYTAWRTYPTIRAGIAADWP